MAGKSAGESEFGGQGGMFTPADKQAEPVVRDREKAWRMHGSDPADATSGPNDVQSA